jgi:hypothetical protein
MTRACVRLQCRTSRPWLSRCLIHAPPPKHSTFAKQPKLSLLHTPVTVKVEYFTHLPR